MKKILIFSLVLSLAVMTGTALAQQTPAPASSPVTAPTPTPAQAAPAAKAAPAAGFTIARMEIASGVENREPVGIAASFPATTEKVYCFLELKNVPANTTITYVWTLGQNEMGKVTQTAKQTYAKYRTWASKTIGGMKGDWKVDVVDESGNVLKSATFKVE